MSTVGAEAPELTGFVCARAEESWKGENVIGESANIRRAVV